MGMQELADEYDQRVNEEIQGLPITLVIPKLMALTAEFLNKAYETGLTDNKAALKIALEESVKLQSHYAKLLNMYDSGERMIFESAESWVERLRSLKVLP